MRDGSYYNWGYNEAGQLGDGTTSDSAVPVHVPLPKKVVQVFQGGSGAKNGQTIAVLSDSSLWTWGNGTHGQLGNGSRASSSNPIRIALPHGARLLRHRYVRETLGLGSKRRRAARDGAERAGPAVSRSDRPPPQTGLLDGAERRRTFEVRVTL